MCLGVPLGSWGLNFGGGDLGKGLNRQDHESVVMNSGAGAVPQPSHPTLGVCASGGRPNTRAVRGDRAGAGSPPSRPPAQIWNSRKTDTRFFVKTA